MDSTCEKFHYKNVDSVVAMFEGLDHGSVTDISSAYRAVHIFPPHRTYQGFQWDSGGGSEYYEDLRLSLD